jgi:hypothetical protein
VKTCETDETVLIGVATKERTIWTRVVRARGTVRISRKFGIALGAIPLVSDLEALMSLSLSPAERLVLIVSGVWLCATAVSIAYLDFPRRKLRLRIASRRPRKIYIDSRRQREELLLFLRTRQLENVMVRVGLDPAGVLGHQGQASTSDHGNGAPK